MHQKRLHFVVEVNNWTVLNKKNLNFRSPRLVRESATNVGKIMALWMRSRPGRFSGRDTIHPFYVIIIVYVLIHRVSRSPVIVYSGIKTPLECMCDLNPTGLYIVDATVAEWYCGISFILDAVCGRIHPRAEEMIVDQSHLCLHHHLSNIRLLLQFLSERWGFWMHFLRLWKTRA